MIFKHDQFDDEAFERALGANPDLGSLMHSVPQGFTQDVFLSLFKMHPQISDKKVPPFLEKHKQLIEEMMATEEWKRFRANSALDVEAAALGTVELVKGVADRIPDDRDAARQLVRGLLEQANCDLNELIELAEAWGSKAGEGGRVDIGQARQLSQVVRRSDNLQRIAELAGRMRRIALQKHRTRTRHSADEIADVELGNDIGRLLPSEFVALKHPALRLDFFRRYSERNLLQYRLIGTEQAGRGPIIVCLDSSASMGGAKDVWAKAVALGLLAIAEEERRDFAVVHFGSANQIRVWQFDPPANPMLVADCLSWFYNGGTNFEQPLDQALSLQEQARFEKGDIVFISDGICDVPDPFLQRFNAARKERGVSVYTVLINCGSAASTAVAKFSDGVEYLTNIHDDDRVLDMVFGM